LKHHYPTLFDAATADHAFVQAFANKVYEFTQFLTQIVGVEKLSQRIDLSHLRVTYHDSCSGLREMSIKEQPRQLLHIMSNVQIQEMPDTNICCGFGGTFCVKYPDISNKMVSDKIHNAQSVNADLLVGGDLSCLLNISGALSKQQDEKTPGVEPSMKVRHVAELLAGNMKNAALGESTK
jgi:L-lactate dehydrogenase complex protein LldE